MKWIMENMEKDFVLSKYIPLLEILYVKSAFSHDLILLSHFRSHGFGRRSFCCLCFV